MIYVYCTFDKVSEEYSMPWFAKNDNVARRNLMIASRRENLPLDDIILVKLGMFNTDLGQLEGLEDVDPFRPEEVTIVQDKEDSK